MIRINLLAEAKRPAAVRRARATSKLSGEQLSQYLLAGALLVAVLACGAYWWLLHSQVRAKEREIRAAQKEVQELDPIIREVEDYKVKQAELEHKISVITELKANQRGPVRVMDEISRALPELLWLTNMEVTSGTVLLEGKAFNTNAIATFTENLDGVPEFQEPDFKDTRREGQIYSFRIFLRYSLAPPAEPGLDEEALPVAAGAGGG